MPSNPSRSFLRRLPLWLGVALIVAGPAYWASQGAHRGWSMNKVPKQQTDEITGLSFTTYEDRFVPGIEVLGGTVGAGVGCLLVAFFVRRKST